MSIFQEPPHLTFLRNDHQGTVILNCYRDNKTLTKTVRSSLARLLIHNEHKGKPTVECLPAARYIELAKNICNLFKSEDSDAWYTPHSGKGGIALQTARDTPLSCNNYLSRDHLRKAFTPSKVSSQAAFCKLINY